MDYNYLELERQIRALQNMVHVPSSGVSKTTEELRNGNNSFVVDTIQHYFMFQYGGVDEPLSIDPITKSILNVKFINSVDVSNIIGGIREGYGINIDAMGGGVYKVNVIENMFALKSDLNELEDMITEIDDTTYTKAECDNKFALVGHNHDSRYSLINHNHDSEYAALTHNHDSQYSLIGHTHNSRYSLITHNHDYLNTVLSVKGLNATENITAPNITTIEDRTTALENTPTVAIDAYTKYECNSRFAPKTLRKNIVVEIEQFETGSYGCRFSGNSHSEYIITGKYFDEDFTYEGKLEYFTVNGTHINIYYEQSENSYAIIPYTLGLDIEDIVYIQSYEQDAYATASQI